MRDVEAAAMRRLAWRSLVRSRRVLAASCAAALFSLGAAFALSRFGFAHAATRYVLIMAFLPAVVLGGVNQANLLGTDSGAARTISGAPGGLVALFRGRALVTLLWNLGVTALALPVGLRGSGWEYLTVGAFQAALILLLGLMGGVTSALLPSPRPYEKIGASPAPLGVSLLLNGAMVVFVLALSVVVSAGLPAAARAAIALATVLACGAGWWHGYARLVPRLLRSRGERILIALQEAA